jgi:hypothetical protein
METKIKSKSYDSDFFFADKADKALYEYVDTKTNKLRDCWQTKLFNEKIEDSNGDIKLAQSLSEGGRVYRYCKVIKKDSENGKQKDWATIHPERHILSLGKYKSGLWKCVEPILQSYGFTSDELKSLEKELTNEYR